MKTPRKILLLAGSAEARQIGVALQDLGWQVQALVSEPPRGPDPMPVPCRMISFADHDVLAHETQGCDLVLDASHGFDGVMTQAGHAAATKLGRPFATLSRPAWDVGESPLWRSAASVKEAVPLIAARTRVFSATGWASLPEFQGFCGEVLLLRQTSRHDRKPPFDFVKPVFGDPPFTIESEKALFALLKVELLICRNLGGGPSRPKLEAAKALDIPVILIDRPGLPPGITVLDSVPAAIEWACAR